MRLDDRKTGVAPPLQLIMSNSEKLNDKDIRVKGGDILRCAHEPSPLGQDHVVASRCMSNYLFVVSLYLGRGH
jgi:hypothetical protein